MSKAEKFIQDYTRKCSNELEGGIYHEWLTPDQALRAVEIAREEVYDWLKNNANKYVIITGVYTKAMITDLKQAMKDE